MRQAFFGADPIRRLNYFAGKLLSADDFTAEQNYHRDKQRRHNLRFHGVGIVRGLKVSTERKNSAWWVAIERGVGIDPAGNEIELCTTARLRLPKSPAAIQVGIRFSERLCAPAPSVSDPALPDSQPSLVEEGCELVLDPVPMPLRSRGKEKGSNVFPGVLSLAHLVRVQGVWRVSRKFKLPSAR